MKTWSRLLERNVYTLFINWFIGFRRWLTCSWDRELWTQISKPDWLTNGVHHILFCSAFDTWLCARSERVDFWYDDSKFVLLNYTSESNLQHFTCAYCPGWITSCLRYWWTVKEYTVRILAVGLTCRRYPRQTGYLIAGLLIHVLTWHHVERIHSSWAVVAWQGWSVQLGPLHCVVCRCFLLSLLILTPSLLVYIFTSHLPKISLYTGFSDQLFECAATIIHVLTPQNLKSACEMCWFEPTSQGVAMCYHDSVSLYS